MFHTEVNSITTASLATKIQSEIRRIEIAINIQGVSLLSSSIKGSALTNRDRYLEIPKAVGFGPALLGRAFVGVHRQTVVGKSP